MKKKSVKAEIDYNFILLAITSPARDYRICSLLNKELFLNLEKADSLSWDREPHGFSVFRYHHEAMHTDFFLLANKCGTQVLVPELRQADYFMIIKGHPEKDYSGKALDQIRKIPFVQTAFEVAVNSLKSRHVLIVE